MNRLLSAWIARVCAGLVTAAMLAVACGGKSPELNEPSALAVAETTTTAAPTTTLPDGPKAPLTGLVALDPASLTRPALAVKIDNIDAGGCETARPQIGIGRADVVYEILVEGITRFMAVFHSNVPETVGPVRSARSSDVDLVAMLGSPLFAWSGANDNVVADFSRIRGRYLDVGHSSGAGQSFYRDDVRCSPHNLLVGPADLYAFAADKKVGVPTPVFTYRAPSQALVASALPTGGVRLTTGQEVVYAWNAQTKSWDRSQRGTPHLAVDGKTQSVISPTNVVVLEVTYAASSTPGSPQAVTLGKGKAHVFTDGKLIEGTWSRAKDADPWTLTDASGAMIALLAGRTWVALAQTGKVEVLDSTSAAKFVKS